MTHSLKLLSEKFEQVIKNQKLNESDSPEANPNKDKVQEAANKYVKSMSKDDMSKYLTKPDNVYDIAFELTHEDIVANSDMMDDDMADAELDSEEVAIKTCEGIAMYMDDSMNDTEAFDLVYDIARPHMPD